MKFTEEKLEQAVIDLFEAEGYKHLTGEQIHKEMPDVLLRDDLKRYLLNRYSNEDFTLYPAGQIGQQRGIRNNNPVFVDRSPWNGRLPQNDNDTNSTSRNSVRCVYPS